MNSRFVVEVLGRL